MRRGEIKFEDFQGMIFSKIEKNHKDFSNIFSNCGEDGDFLVFFEQSGRIFLMGHDQNCCENVRIEDICGDLNDLVDSPILMATETSNKIGGHCESVSQTWTFYNISTNKGSVTLRWLGSSNGYYSERVDLIEYLED